MVPQGREISGIAADFVNRYIATAMRQSLSALSRSAWKGELDLRSSGHLPDDQARTFTAFPSLSEALKNNTPIYTKSRACTVVPNFVASSSWCTRARTTFQ